MKLARNLLSDTEVIFVSIDDNEQANLKLLMDEVFGEDNFVGEFIIKSTPNARDYGDIGKMHEFVLFYSKDNCLTETNLLPDLEKKFSYSDDKGGFNIHPLYNSNEAFHKGNRPNLYYPFYLNPSLISDNGFYQISLEKSDDFSIEIFPPKSQKNQIPFVWRWGKKNLINLSMMRL
ncbi:DNA methyltransferase [Pseudolactococcus yaeyamensis]